MRRIKTKIISLSPRWPRLFDVALDLEVSSPILPKLNKAIPRSIAVSQYIYVAMFLTILKQLLGSNILCPVMIGNIRGESHAGSTAPCETQKNMEQTDWRIAPVK